MGNYYLDWKKGSSIWAGDVMHKGYICVMKHRKYLWDERVQTYSVYVYGQEEATLKAKEFLKMLEDLGVEKKFAAMARDV